MSAISRRAAALLLALVLLALPFAARDSGSAGSRSDAPFTYTAPHDAKLLRPQPSVVAKDERQRLSGGSAAVVPARLAAFLSGRSATPTSRLSRLALRHWPRVGHQRDPPAT